MRVEKMLEHEDASTAIVDQRRQVVNVLAKLSEDELRAIAHGSAIALPNAEITAG